jgi:hypothetical protein
MLTKSIQSLVRNSSLRLTHLKVYFNKTKIADYTNNGLIYLKDVLPKLKPNKLYGLNLYYKEDGMYHETELIHAYVFIDDDNKIIICCQKKSFYDSLPEKQYVKVVGDYYLIGQSTKKLVIEEVPFSIVDLHVHAGAINKHTLIIWKNELNIQDEVAKMLSEYDYDWVGEIEMNERCKLDENGLVIQKDVTNTICIEVKINRKRTIWERISLWFK